MYHVVKFHYWETLAYAILDKNPAPPEDGSKPDGKPKWMARATSHDDAKKKVEELQKERPAGVYVIKVESGRMRFDSIPGVRRIMQCPAPEQVRDLPEMKEGAEPPEPPFIGVVLVFPPPPDKPPDAEPALPLPARKTEEEREHPRWIEVFNDSAKLMYRYDL